jgi:hypothetical protein
MLASVSAFALPIEIKKTEKPTTTAATVVAGTNPMVSLSQLQEENAMLKTQLMNLINENEELKSRLAFETTMRNMLSLLNENRQQEKVEDMKATIQYNQLMANMLLKLKK